MTYEAGVWWSRAGLCGHSGKGPLAHSHRWSKPGSLRRPVTLFAWSSLRPGSIDQTRRGLGQCKALAAPQKSPLLGSDHADEIPAAGRMVRFTGNVPEDDPLRRRGHRSRLAPLARRSTNDRRLIASEPVESQADNALIRTSRGSGSVIQLAFWALGLAVAAMVAVVLARWHLRAQPAGVATRRAKSAQYMTPDPPLEFIGPPDEL